MIARAFLRVRPNILVFVAFLGTTITNAVSLMFVTFAILVVGFPGS